VHAFLEKAGTGERGIYQIELALDELVSNVIKYSYRGSQAARPVDVRVSLEESGIVLTIEDEGPPFNPLEAAEPEHPDNLESARIGGLGIQMVRMSSKRIQYERLAGGNRVMVTIARD
jgi:anti-sigma regulatory factor (Ser/Thr protein kinase)